MILIHTVIAVLSLTQTIYGLGLIIEPCLVGDKKKYSSINNLQNCISYPTVKDDIIMVRIKSGDKIASQRLNLNIFDSENNKIRFKKDISHEMNLIFTNLNNPAVVNSELESSQVKRSNIFGRWSGLVHHEEAGGGGSGGSGGAVGAGAVGAGAGGGSGAVGGAGAGTQTASTDSHLDSNKGKSLIYICFDNVYTDRSWSFHAQPKDVELYTEVKNMNTIKDTNYNNYAHYFNKFKDSSAKSEEEEEKTKQRSSEEFTQEDFENEVKILQHELEEVIEKLKSSEDILRELMEQEYRLRDANEAIYSGYTKISIIMLVCTFVAGLIQMAYQTYFLRKQKVI
ncbi:hypothetical protein CLIB1423_13S01244 [[Candida] railenensis]|uniref:GOLD domain-containing protein n=1 Tax=[Candida] railenensis TaxID=45579 RepID=A0A9P0QSP2_9ASCO|nr:hypothetical protein CLIB1423_13S01244 [[Candida] railenensis]